MRLVEIAFKLFLNQIAAAMESREDARQRQHAYHIHTSCHLTPAVMERCLLRLLLVGYL